MSTGADLAHRRKRVVELYLYEHRTQKEIAAELGVSQATISNDLARLQAEWQETAQKDYDQAKSLQLARIDQLEREYWSAWKQSLGENEMDERSKTEKRGNPRYLQGVQWCINKRCELLGIDTGKSANTRVDVTFSDLVKGVHADNK